MKKFRSDKQDKLIKELFEICQRIDSRTLNDKKLNLDIIFGDNLIKKIVEDSFEEAKYIEDLPKIMTRKKKNHKNNIALIEEIKDFFDGSKKQEHSLIFEYINNNYICYYGDKVIKDNKSKKIDLSYIFLNNIDSTPYHLYEGLYYKKACLLACKNGHLQILKDHFEHNNKSKDIFNDDYLIQAAKNNHKDIVLYLIERGLNYQLALDNGTLEIKLFVNEWKSKNPGEQINLITINNDIDNMLKNPPEWMNRFSYFRLQVSNAEYSPIPDDYEESVKLVFETVAFLKNNAGQLAVNKYLEKILLKEPRQNHNEENDFIVGQKLWNNSLKSKNKI